MLIMIMIRIVKYNNGDSNSDNDMDNNNDRGNKNQPGNNDNTVKSMMIVIIIAIDNKEWQ